MKERTKEIGDHSMAERRIQAQRVVVTMEFGNRFGDDVRRNKSHLAASGGARVRAEANNRLKRTKKGTQRQSNQRSGLGRGASLNQGNGGTATSWAVAESLFWPVAAPEQLRRLPLSSTAQWASGGPQGSLGL